MVGSEFEQCVWVKEHVFLWTITLLISMLRIQLSVWVSYKRRLTFILHQHVPVLKQHINLAHNLQKQFLKIRLIYYNVCACNILFSSNGRQVNNMLSPSRCVCQSPFKELVYRPLNPLFHFDQFCFRKHETSLKIISSMILLVNTTTWLLILKKKSNCLDKIVTHQ